MNSLQTPVIAGGGNHFALPFIFEGKEYEWPKQYILGAQLRELFKISPDAELYLEIQDPWKDEPVPNNKEIDLARPGIEQFFVKKKLPYTINGVEFESAKQYIKGAHIRRQGDIPNDEHIYLSIKGPWEDELVRDDDWVDLARPGIEHFYSKKVDVKVVIIINGTAVNWDKDKISFMQIIVEAFGKYIDSPTMVYTVGYEDGPKQNPDGSMYKGDVVFVKNKMIFHATATDKS
jgi:hypothetical protein